MKRLAVFFVGTTVSLFGGHVDISPTSNSFDTPLSGEYSCSGNASCPVGGPYLLSGGGGGSDLEFDPDSVIPFGVLTGIDVQYTVTGSTGAGGGFPELIVSFMDGNFVSILLGTSPNFNDSPSQLDNLSGENLLNDDAGRFNTADFAGGSDSTTYAAALPLIGGELVTQVDLLVSGGGDRPEGLDVTAINLVTPEPSTVFSLLGGLATFCAMVFKKK